MKPNTHPKYKEIKVTCSCGNTFVTASTFEKDELHVDICSACHPFYTGKQKVVDTGGRIERFKNKYKPAAALEKPKEEPKVAAKAKAAKKPAAKKKSEV